VGLRIQKFLQEAREGCLESSRAARYPSGRCSVVRHRLSDSSTPLVERFFASAVRWHGERASPLADARVSPRVAERAPSPQYAPSGKGSHQFVTEQVSAHCTHCIPDPSTPSSRIVRVASTTSKGLHCGGLRRRDACVHCAQCSLLVHLHSESSSLASGSSSLAFSEEVSLWKEGQEKVGV
jgi:hypothetical protein